MRVGLRLGDVSGPVVVFSLDWSLSRHPGRTTDHVDCWGTAINGVLELGILSGFQVDDLL